MDGFNINKIILGLQNPALFLKKLHNTQESKLPTFAPELNQGALNTKAQGQTLQALQNAENIAQQIQMNALPNIDRASFIRNMLGLPQNLSDTLLMLQNTKFPINGGTLGIMNINQELLNTQKALAEIFNESSTSQSVANLTELTNIQAQQANTKQDVVALLYSGMISMPDISKLIVQNGKQAVASLIIAMASASKQGLNSDQIQQTLTVINSCIAMAESEQPMQSLKSLMMLYIPWLPLNEGVGFDLEITPQNGENESNNSKLTVLIQTKNYGNIKGEFTLTTSNSIDILIICEEGFPKKTLQQSLMAESTSHAMNTNIDIEEIAEKKEIHNETQETKVNLSATNEMNPYLLLMAHSFIRNAIMIDNNTSLAGV